jgi:hypothetical protein
MPCKLGIYVGYESVSIIRYLDPMTGNCHIPLYWLHFLWGSFFGPQKEVINPLMIKVSIFMTHVPLRQTKKLKDTRFAWISKSTVLSVLSTKQGTATMDLDIISVVFLLTMKKLVNVIAILNSVTRRRLFMFITFWHCSFFLHHCLFSNQASYAMRVTFWSKAGHQSVVLVRWC